MTKEEIIYAAIRQIANTDKPERFAEINQTTFKVAMKVAELMQPSLHGGLEYYNKIIDELENRSRMSAPEATKAAKWMKEFYRSPSIYPSGNVGIAENSAKPQEPQGLKEAARAYMPKPNGIESNTDFSFMQMVWMFEQGASWMAGQGDIVETEPYFCDEEGNAEVTAATTFKPGDKVFVQIRKAK